MKKRIIYAILVIVCLFGIGATAAYLSDADQADNRLMIGGNNTKIVEEFDPPEKLKPGISFKKDVKVVNLGPSDCYVRIKAVFTDGGMEKYCTLDYNDQDFVYDKEDGYYYYKSVLKEGEKTPSLFTTVKITEDAPENSMKDFDILVYTESYQSKGFSDYQAAWEHFQKNKPQ